MSQPRRPSSSMGHRLDQNGRVGVHSRPKSSMGHRPRTSKTIPRGNIGADAMIEMMNQTGKHNWQEEYNLGHARNYQGPPRQLGIGGILVT